MATALRTVEPPPGTGKLRPVRTPGKIVRKTAKDRSQVLRRSIQYAFLTLNLVIGVQFYFFVRHFESGGVTPAVSRPAGVEGWLPIAGLLNLKYFLFTGRLPEIHGAAMFLLVSFILISLLFRKAFCSWLCPIGTISEFLWLSGKKIFRRNRIVPRPLDLSLRSLKYILMVLFLYVAASMTPAAIHAFMGSPYGLIADVKMLDFFRYLGTLALLIVAALVVLSLFVQNFWCRYLCPYGALLSIPALLSPARIRRDTERCVDCNKCNRACPSLLPVDKLITVRSVECTGCLECVAACPVTNALNMSIPGRRRLSAWALAAGIAVLFFGIVIYARMAGAWKSPIPDATYQDLIPRADEFHHY
jgi:polyferredoxin